MAPTEDEDSDRLRGREGASPAAWQDGAWPLDDASPRVSITPKRAPLRAKGRAPASWAPYLHDTRKTTGEYAHELIEADHVELLDVLLKCEGKVMLSGYPVGPVRRHADGQVHRTGPVDEVVAAYKAAEAEARPQAA